MSAKNQNLCARDGCDLDAEWSGRCRAHYHEDFGHPTDPGAPPIVGLDEEFLSSLHALPSKDQDRKTRDDCGHCGTSLCTCHVEHEANDFIAKILGEKRSLAAEVAHLRAEVASLNERLSAQGECVIAADERLVAARGALSESSEDAEKALRAEVEKLRASSYEEWTRQRRLILDKTAEVEKLTTANAQLESEGRKLIDSQMQRAESAEAEVEKLRAELARREREHEALVETAQGALVDAREKERIAAERDIAEYLVAKITGLQWRCLDNGDEEEGEIVHAINGVTSGAYRLNAEQRLRSAVEQVCTCGIDAVPSVPDPRLSWRHKSFCAHAAEALPSPPSRPPARGA
ncbi:MAG: hypothetical protein ACHREM_29090 [Polyangiales bacterium]